MSAFEKIKGLRIGATVFVCGAVLMAVEIAGGRLLAPHYGSGAYVWGSIIATILGGLAIGYYLGGALADKKPDYRALALLVALAAAFIAAIPLAHGPAAKAFAFLPRAAEPLATATLLLLPPSVLLGTVSPFAVRLKAKNLNSIGGLSGNLYALSTLGSVGGTFLTTFVLIMLFPLTTIFLALAAVLAAVAAALAGKKWLCVSGALLILLLLALIPVAEQAPSALPAASGENAGEDMNLARLELPPAPVDERMESLYGLVRVFDEGDVRKISINGGVMGAVFPQNREEAAPGWGYLDCMENAALARPAGNALVLGVGAGILPFNLAYRHGVKVDAVELNPVVLEASKKYFGFAPNKLLSVHCDDARMFLKGSDKKYDLIEMDVFRYENGSYIIPPHLTTKEFFQEARNSLAPDGIFTIMVVGEEDSHFLKSEYKTINSVFSNVYAFNCGPTVIMASQKPIPLEGFLENLARRHYQPDWKSGTVFTDDYTPIAVPGG